MTSKLSQVFILCFSLFFFCNKSSAENALLHVKSTFGGGLEIRLDGGVNLGSTVEQREEISNLLLNFPETILARNLANVDGLDEHSSQKKYCPEFFYENSKQFPMGLLMECTGFSCELNRLNQSWLRNTFEKEVLNAVRSLHSNKSQTLVYTSFASGSLFSDFVLITKLINNGYKNLKINFIDLNFDEVIATLNDQENGIVTDHIFDENDYARGFFLRRHVYQLTQLLDWLNQENISFSVCIYPDVNAYVKDCENDIHNKAHIVVGSDYFDEMSHEAKIYQDLNSLACCVQKNGIMCSLYTLLPILLCQRRNELNSIKGIFLLRDFFPRISLKKKMSESQKTIEHNFKNITPFMLNYSIVYQTLRDMFVNREVTYNQDDDCCDCD